MKQRYQDAKKEYLTTRVPPPIQLVPVGDFVDDRLALSYKRRTGEVLVTDIKMLGSGNMQYVFACTMVGQAGQFVLKVGKTPSGDVPTFMNGPYRKWRKILGHHIARVVYWGTIETDYLRPPDPDPYFTISVRYQTFSGGAADESIVRPWFASLLHMPDTALEDDLIFADLKLANLGYTFVDDKIVCVLIDVESTSLVEGPSLSSNKPLEGFSQPIPKSVCPSFAAENNMRCGMPSGSRRYTHANMLHLAEIMNALEIPSGKYSRDFNLRCNAILAYIRDERKWNTTRPPYKEWIALLTNPTTTQTIA